MADIKTNSSVASGAGLAILGTTCCALPIALVSLGMGSTVASLVSALPWLATLSKYKIITFSLTALVLAYSWWQVRKVSACSIKDAQRLRLQSLVLKISTALFLIAIFAAYALLPITLWLES
jgi:mercuric ion transport protein